MVREAVYGRGKVRRKKVVRTIDGRTKDVVPVLYRCTITRIDIYHTLCVCITYFVKYTLQYCHEIGKVRSFREK